VWPALNASTMSRWRLFPQLLSLGLAAAALAACSGAVLGTGADCTSSTALLTQVTGECTRTLDRLEQAAPQTIAIQTADVAPFATVAFEVTVASGQVDVTFTDSRGDDVTVRARPRAAATGQVRLQLDALNQIRFTLTPVDGAATDVSYTLQFVCDCLP